MMKIRYLLPGLLFIVAVTAPLLSYAEAGSNYQWNFLPLTIAFACDETTPTALRQLVERAHNAQPSVSGLQCVDVRRRVVDIKPTSMNMVHLKKLDQYEVRLTLNPNDALALQKITATASGQRTILLVSGQAVIDSAFFGPFHGNVFEISADTEDDAIKTASLFVKRSGHVRGGFICQ